jgi:AcrR family transcriptional regulator
MNGYEKRTKQKKDSILHAAQELFFKHGVTDTSISDIAAKAKVSQGSIYNYFGSKENILNEVMHEHMTKAINSAEAVLELELPFSQKIEMMFSLRDKSDSTLSQDFLSSVAWNDPAIEKLFREISTEKIYSFISRFIELGKKEGAVDKSISAEAVMAHIAAYMTIFTNPDFLNTSTEYKQGIYRLFYYGILGK